MNAFHRLHTLRIENDQAGYDMAEQAPRFQRLAARHENGTAPRAVWAPQLFQTPPALAQRLVALLPAESLRGRVLEPSAGLGRLLDAIAPAVPVATVAVEIAPACASVLYQQERPGVRLIQRDFLTLTPAELGQFDAIAMNPPFTMRSDIRHIEHALTFLAPGGTLAALCMDTPHREKAFRERALTWEKIPAGAFAKEGTNAPTVLFTLCP